MLEQMAQFVIAQMIAFAGSAIIGATVGLLVSVGFVFISDANWKKAIPFGVAVGIAFAIIGQM